MASCRELAVKKLNYRSLLASLVLALLLWTMSKAEGPSDLGMEPCWRLPVSGPIAGSLLMDESNVYTVDSEKGVIAVDRRSGFVNWGSEVGGSIAAPMISTRGSIILLNFVVSGSGHSTELRALSKMTGIVQWVSKLQSANNATIRSYDEAVVVIGDSEATIAINTVDGSVLWKRTNSVQYAGLKPSRGLFAIPGANGFEILRVPSGNILARYEGPELTKAFALSKQNQIFLGDSKGIIKLIRAGDGAAVWTYKTGGAVSWLIPSGDELLAGSADNFLYSLTGESGNVEWKRKLPGRISSLTLAGATRAAVAVVGDRSAYIVNLESGDFVDQLSLDGEDELLAASLAGDQDGIAALSSKGITMFGTDCKKQKAAGQSRRL